MEVVPRVKPSAPLWARPHWEQAGCSRNQVRNWPPALQLGQRNNRQRWAISPRVTFMTAKTPVANLPPSQGKSADTGGTFVRGDVSKLLGMEFPIVLGRGS